MFTESVFKRLALVLLASLPATAAFCDEQSAPPQCAIERPDFTPTGALGSVTDYASVLKVCRAAGGRRALALRAFRVGGEAALLLADPETLTTNLARAACWTCEEASEAGLAGTRLMRAVARSAEAPGVAHRGFLENAGLAHGAGVGAYVTGDLCPSPRPLDRSFFDSLIAAGPHTPVALSISGLWLAHHREDFAWLADKQASGALDIVWVNHTYRHPYFPAAPDAQNYLLTPGVDVDAEILDNERLLIANGAVPSAFFRFPGLVSSAPLMQAVRRHHLIALGADAWLALSQNPGRGSIVLVHPNGNEEAGLRLFARDWTRGAIARPLEAVTAAPD